MARNGNWKGGPEGRKRLCTYVGCEKVEDLRRDLCGTHYKRLRLYGDPSVVHPSGARIRREDVSYSGIHYRVRADRGDPGDRSCSCGSTAEEWALNNDTPPERVRWGKAHPRAQILSPYSESVDDYLPLCVRCHRRYDLAASEGPLYSAV